MAVNFKERISDYEYNLLYKFLEYYKEQEYIVADEYTNIFSYIPLENRRVTFIKEDELKKRIYIEKKIYNKGKKYIITLELAQNNLVDSNSKYAAIKSLVITHNEDSHIIHFNTKNYDDNTILHSIVDIFNEDKIISPLEAYRDSIVSNNELRVFIYNHDFERIESEIDSDEELTNKLFILEEGNEFYLKYGAKYATILYHLINYRINNPDISQKDLLKLDRLIAKLKNKELLKVRFIEKDTEIDLCDNGQSFLLDNKIYCKTQEYKQYTIMNDRLDFEKRNINKCIRTLKKS